MTSDPPVYIIQVRNISIELILSARTEKNWVSEESSN